MKRKRVLKEKAIGTAMQPRITEKMDERFVWGSASALRKPRPDNDGWRCWIIIYQAARYSEQTRTVARPSQ